MLALLAVISTQVAMISIHYTISSTFEDGFFTELYWSSWEAASHP
jgi:hypothetical protein